jgi:hypothetical protein
VHDNPLILPHGEWEGGYFSKELKFAEKNGYEISVLSGYQFNRVENVFNDSVDDLCEKKSTSTGSKKWINKFLLNSLLERFGMDITKLITKILTVSEWQELSNHVLLLNRDSNRILSIKYLFINNCLFPVLSVFSTVSFSFYHSGLSNISAIVTRYTIRKSKVYFIF